MATLNPAAAPSLIEAMHDEWEASWRRSHAADMAALSLRQSGEKCESLHLEAAMNRLHSRAQSLQDSILSMRPATIREALILTAHIDSTDAADPAHPSFREGQELRDRAIQALFLFLSEQEGAGPELTGEAGSSIRHARQRRERESLAPVEMGA
jgi:hypothetical protein